MWIIRNPSSKKKCVWKTVWKKTLIWEESEIVNKLYVVYFQLELTNDYLCLMPYIQLEFTTLKFTFCCFMNNIFALQNKFVLWCLKWMRFYRVRLFNSVWYFVISFVNKIKNFEQLSIVPKISIIGAISFCQNENLSRLPQ